MLDKQAIINALTLHLVETTIERERVWEENANLKETIRILKAEKEENQKTD